MFGVVTEWHLEGHQRCFLYLVIAVASKVEINRVDLIQSVLLTLCRVKRIHTESVQLAHLLRVQSQKVDLTAEVIVVHQRPGVDEAEEAEPEMQLFLGDVLLEIADHKAGALRVRTSVAQDRVFHREVYLALDKNRRHRGNRLAYDYTRFSLFLSNNQVYADLARVQIDVEHLRLVSVILY